MLTSKKLKKNNKMRKIEYYDMQDQLDLLHKQSEEGKSLNKLMGIIESPSNIKLAYRNLKNNRGSQTQGTDGKTIKDYESMDEDKFIRIVQQSFKWYIPKAVRRVDIPKSNGKTRPLGIPTILDRIVQQCIKQVLEPICEAKFHEQSYGFRPCMSAENAISRCQNLAQLAHLHYVVDIDIKGFFDNVNHSKLIKQMWAMGIRDKKLISIIKSMLKAPIEMPDGTIEMPTKGTPQGGVLSPLLANIVLNELDWWIASQWGNFRTKRQYSISIRSNGTLNEGSKLQALKKTKLKEMYSVRYADDFKIFCRNKNDAEKIYHGVVKWLLDRLKLEVSPEKSKVVNLKKQYSEYLGYKFKVHYKAGKWVILSHVSDKALKQAKIKLDTAMKPIKKANKLETKMKAISFYNSTVIGLHNYFRIATHCNLDFQKLDLGNRRRFYNRLKYDGLTNKGTLTNDYYKKMYGKSKQIMYLNEYPILPIAYVQHKKAMGKNRKINPYTPEGRKIIHDKLTVNEKTLRYLIQNPVQGKSMEYNDNRISLYSGQFGKCAITGEELTPHNMHCHHVKPIKKGGTDKYKNLKMVIVDIHILIHATIKETIEKYLSIVKLNSQQMIKVNKLRKSASLEKI